jgi:hypothetical protein
MRRLIPAAAVIGLLVGGSTARAGDPVSVAGGGLAVLTDPSGVVYPYAFELTANRDRKGKTTGDFSALFPNPFANAWGAVPGVDLIVISGSVSSLTVGPHGAVVIEGTLTERDFTFGEGLVFLEENVPFRIDLGGDLGRGEFLLQWCELPTFPSEVLLGYLAVR